MGVLCTPLIGILYLCETMFMLSDDAISLQFKIREEPLHCMQLRRYLVSAYEFTHEQVLTSRLVL